MTKLGRSTTIRFLVVAMLVLAATSWAQTRPPIAEQIAKTYGLDSFGQIEAIRYTFNLDLGALKLSRAWVWEPKADRISYAGKDKAGKPVKATYVRARLCRKFCLGGRAEAVAPVGGGIKRPGSRTIRPQ